MLRNYIDGTWELGSGPEVRDENPTDPREVVATFRLSDADAVDRAVAAAAAAFPAWSSCAAPERGALLDRAAQTLDDRAEAYGRELTIEEGKTLAEGIGEVRRAAECLRYYAAEARHAIGEILPSPRPGEQIWALRVPVGPVGVITPWNFPIAIPAWKIASALVYGNTVVWKPSEVVPLLAVRLTEVLEEAGAPPGVVNLVLGDGTVGSRIVESPPIRACTFTGSTEIGRRVIASGAAHGTKVQAEMGGKNAAVVFADADLDHAAAQILSGAMRSTGQKCTATSRVVVEASVHDELVDRLVAGAASLVVGDPLDPGTDLGPLVSAAQHDKVRGYLGVATDEGAHLASRPGPLPDHGYFVSPSVVTGVGPDDRIYLEEVFGPVVAVVPAADEQEAFALANRGPYGLSGAVFTTDFARALRAVHQLDVGVLHLNSETTGADPHVPFGGRKASGTADREQGTAARHFWTEIRTVYASAPDPV